jgi:hypothetical protein
MRIRPVSNHLDTLLTEAVNLAETLLEKNGDFFPFGVALTADGNLIRIEDWSDQHQLTVGEAIAILSDRLRIAVCDERYRSTAVVSDVRLRDRKLAVESDAIRVDIQDCQSSPITCFVPYAIENGAVETRDVIAIPGDTVGESRPGRR